MKRNILFVIATSFLLFSSLFVIGPLIVEATDFPDPEVSANTSQVQTYVDSQFSVDFTIVNNGYSSSGDSFLTLSVSNGLEIVSYSSTPYLPDFQFSPIHIGQTIWYSDGSQHPSFFEMLDVHGHPYSASESVTVTVEFLAPPWFSAHWIKYRAAMLPEGINYPTDVPTARDPTSSGVIDQQGYPVYVVNVEVFEHEGEWFAQVTYDPFDSDGDGNNDAVRIGMNSDTDSGGTMTVHVYNTMYRNFGAHGFVDDDSQEWQITGTNVEWEYSFLYVSFSHPYGNYKVILHLYDELNNLEDEYIFYVDLYPGEANPRKWIQDVEVNYLCYDNSGPIPWNGYPNVIEISINADTEGGEENVEVYGNLTDDEGNVLDYSGTGGWTIHGTDVEWEEMYLWLDPPNPPGYYWVKLELYNWVSPENLEDTWEGLVGPLYPTGYEPTPPHQLTISVTPSEGGTTVPSAGTYMVDDGQFFTVAQNPNPGYVFGHWELNGDLVGDGPSYTVYMNADHVLTAVMKERKFITDPSIEKFPFGLLIEPEDGGSIGRANINLRISLVEIIGRPMEFLTSLVLPSPYDNIAKVWVLYAADVDGDGEPSENELKIVLKKLRPNLMLELEKLAIKYNYIVSSNVLYELGKVNLDMLAEIGASARNHAGAIAMVAISLRIVLAGTVTPTHMFGFGGFQFAPPLSPIPTQYWQKGGDTRLMTNSPVDLEVTDEIGRTVNKTHCEIPGARYLEEDLTGDGEANDLIILPNATLDYVVEVIPEIGAAPNDTFTLIAGSDWVELALEENCTIQNIPTDGYNLSSYDGEFLQSFSHDVTIADIAYAKTVIGQSFSLLINVTVQNPGAYEEVFDLIAYANTTSIDTPINVVLGSGNSTTITLTWNATGVAKGNYTISAYAEPVPGETDVADNNFTDGWVIVAMVGDITGPDGWPDGVCDIRDVSKVAKLFGAIYPDPKYDPNCDVVYDLIIDIQDISTVAKHFGEIDP